MSPEARAWWAVAAWAALILTLTSIPLPAGEGPPTWPVDKLAHLFLYAGLGVLLARAATIGRGSGARWAASLLAAAVFAAMDEWHQAWVGRNPSVTDWAADVAGLLIGSAAYRWLPGGRHGNPREESGRETA